MSRPAWHVTLHLLWTKAVGTKDYDKRQWIDFEQELQRMQEKIDAQEEEKPK